MPKHTGPISGVASYLEDWVATAGYDNRVILWQAESQTPVSEARHDHLVNHCTFSPDGGLLLTSSSDHTARLWSVPELKLISVLSDHQDDVEMAAFHPTREFIATASRDHRVRVFDFQGRLVSAMIGHTADVISLAWTADGGTLISSGDDGTIRTWDPLTGVGLTSLGDGQFETDTVVLSKNGWIISGNDEGEITLLLDGGISRCEKAHSSGIKRLCLSHDGKLLASMSYDRSLKIWTVHPDGSLSLRSRSQFPSVVWPRSCAFRGRDQLIVGTFGDSYATFNLTKENWDLSSVRQTGGLNAVVAFQGDHFSIGDAGALVREGRPVGNPGTLCNFLVPFEDVLLTGGQMGVVYNAMSGKELYQHRSPLNCAAVFERNAKKYVIIGTYTGEGLVFSLDHGEQLKLEATVSLHRNAVKGIAADQEHLFSVCATGAAALHELTEFKKIWAIDQAHTRIANGCVSLGDGSFASVSRDLKLRIWERNGNARVFDAPHDRSIKCVSASLDGRWIATGSYNGRVCVFDTLRQDWRVILRPTYAGISSICWDQEQFVASSYDGNIYPIRLSEVADAAS